MSIKALRDYHNLHETDLGERGLSNAALMAKTTYTVTSTVTAVILKAKAQALIEAIAICQKSGDQTDTINKNKIKAELIALMDTLCNDVENAANEANNPAIVPAFGFTLANSTHTGTTPGATAILGVTNPGPGQLGVELLVVASSWCYVVEDTLLPNGPVKTYTFTDPNDVVLTGLMSGSMHSLRACTMVAKNKTGPWCDPVQHMST